MSSTAARLLAELAANALLTKQDLAERYGVSVRTIEIWTAAKRLPRAFYPAGQRSPRWRMSDIMHSEKTAFQK